jgi:hypothetical protein
MRHIDTTTRKPGKNNRVLAWLVALQAMFFSGCDLRDGLNGASEDVGESKRRGVFVCEYGPPANPYRINDSLVLHINECWLERRWVHDKNRPTGADPYSGMYQLIMEVGPNDLRGYGKKGWTIGLDFVQNFSKPTPNALVMLFNEGAPRDTEEWLVIQGEPKKQLSGKEVVLGRLVLKRKPTAEHRPGLVDEPEKP